MNLVRKVGTSISKKKKFQFSYLFIIHSFLIVYSLVFMHLALFSWLINNAIQPSFCIFYCLLNTFAVI